MNIIKESQETKRQIVTFGGRKVTIYTTNAKGKNKILGCIHGESEDRVGSWALDGSGGMYNDDKLTLYNPEKHFDWKMLPGWANAYIFQKQGDWYCTSMEPKWSESGYVVNKKSNSYILPMVVSQDILMGVTDRDSLFKNPKYEE